MAIIHPEDSERNHSQHVVRHLNQSKPINGTKKNSILFLLVVVLILSCKDSEKNISEQVFKN